MDIENVENVDGLAELSEFVFDQFTPESDDETRIDESPDVPLFLRLVPKGQTRRKRARKACVACNKRKVRCDVLSRGHTCTNCRLDGITCAIRSGGKRTRGKLPALVEEVPVCSPDEIIPSQLILPTDGPAVIESIETGLDMPSAKPYRDPSSPVFPNYNIPVQFTPHTDMIFAYFDFLETEPLSHIPPEDFKFLENKGCFHIPQRPMLDDLVREYFLHVHPGLPVIDERRFWEMYLSGGRRPECRKIPLFLFRAMLFVSCAFASDATIRQLGFQSALQARSCMYRRAKLLYDFDTISDPISIAQGALILTYYSSDREPLANTSWLHLAIQYAMSVNVQMYDHDTSLTTEERLTRKRLWWCLILRDRILPLGVRRQIQITRDSFDLSQSKLTVRDLEPEFGSSNVYDRETKSHLTRIFLSQLDLAIELTDLISYIYPASGIRSYDNLDRNATLLTLSKIQQCRESLDTWNSDFKKSVLSVAGSTKHKSLSLYIGLTSIYYQSARVALYQYESFVLQTDDSTANEPRMKELGSSLHSAIASISETIRDFLHLDVAQYIPVSAVAYLALPIILNSLDLQTLTPANSRTEAKRRQLRFLNEAMDICHERYTGCILAQSVINRVIEVARSEHEVRQSTALLYSSSVIKNWFDVFVRKPTQYLRISFTIDISLSIGRYPDTDDYLPQRLSLQTCPNPIQSPPQTLISSIECSPENCDQPDEVGTIEPARNTQLDFFDFGEPDSWDVSENNPWSGELVERMLDEALCG